MNDQDEDELFADLERDLDEAEAGEDQGTSPEPTSDTAHTPDFDFSPPVAWETISDEDFELEAAKGIEQTIAAREAQEDAQDQMRANLARGVDVSEMTDAQFQSLLDEGESASDPAVRESARLLGGVA